MDSLPPVLLDFISVFCPLMRAEVCVPSSTHRKQVTKSCLSRFSRETGVHGQGVPSNRGSERATPAYA
jgi:hypothetical protein